jgi:hypothetical protein
VSRPREWWRLHSAALRALTDRCCRTADGEYRRREQLEDSDGFTANTLTIAAQAWTTTGEGGSPLLC